MKKFKQLDYSNIEQKLSNNISFVYKSNILWQNPEFYILRDSKYWLKREMGYETMFDFGPPSFMSGPTSGIPIKK